MEQDYIAVAKRLDKDFLGMPEYIEELVEFYKEFLDSNALEDLLVHVFRYHYNPVMELNKPRLMINNIMRLVKLADDIEQIRPGKDTLKIFFLVVCIETLYKIADINIKRKYKIVIDFFTEFIAEGDKELLLEKVKYSLADKRFEIEQRKDESDEEYARRLEEEVDTSFNTSITIEVFARIITAARNIFAHEGNYYSFTFPKNFDYALLQSVELVEEENHPKELRIYEFTLDYNQFRRICINGFINFVRDYLEQKD